MITFILLGAAAWIAAGVGVAVAIGKVVKRRDEEG
jgi:hypothetical protein